MLSGRFGLWRARISSYKPRSCHSVRISYCSHSCPFSCIRSSHHNVCVYFPFWKKNHVNPNVCRYITRSVGSLCFAISRRLQGQSHLPTTEPLSKIDNASSLLSSQESVSSTIFSKSPVYEAVTSHGTPVYWCRVCRRCQTQAATTPGTPDAARTQSLSPRREFSTEKQNCSYCGRLLVHFRSPWLGSLSTKLKIFKKIKLQNLCFLFRLETWRQLKFITSKIFLWVFCAWRYSTREKN